MYEDLDFLLTLGIVAISVSAYVCSIMSYIVVHKTLTGRLFTRSGYLTLTLPVTLTRLLPSASVAPTTVIALFTSMFVV